jgi:Uma2 family endonuclease
MLMVRKTERKFTYTDYITWPDEERWELIDGQAYNMTPAPTFKHQKIVFNFASLLRDALKGNPCVAGIAPTDIVLSEFDVVQPDVFVVCDEKKITEANTQGSPNLIIEVISPCTALKDKREKKALYERYGVKEYILIDPICRYTEHFVLQNDGFYGKGEILGSKEVLLLTFLKKLKSPLWEVFEVEGPEDEE